MGRASVLCICVCVSPLCIGPAAAQDLEPRAYAALPIGVNFVVVAAGRSSGGVVVDPSLPLEDVDASVGTVSVGYGRTLNIFNRTALIVAALPFARVKASGRVFEDDRRVSALDTSPDGRTLAVACNGTIQIVRVPRG